MIVIDYFVCIFLYCLTIVNSIFCLKSTSPRVSPSRNRYTKQNVKCRDSKKKKEVEALKLRVNTFAAFVFNSGELCMRYHPQWALDSRQSTVDNTKRWSGASSDLWGTAILLASLERQVMALRRMNFTAILIGTATATIGIRSSPSKRRRGRNKTKRTKRLKFN